MQMDKAAENQEAVDEIQKQIEVIDDLKEEIIEEVVESKGVNQ